MRLPVKPHNGPGLLLRIGWQPFVTALNFIMLGGCCITLPIRPDPLLVLLGVWPSRMARRPDGIVAVSVLPSGAARWHVLLCPII
jgi:hypothetical protein